MARDEKVDGGLFGAGKRASARFYLSHIMFPVIDNVAASHGMTVDDQVAEMIRKNDSIRSHLDDPKVVEKLKEVIVNPGVRFLLSRFKGYLNLSKDEVLVAIPWWMNRIKETRPSFYRVLVKEPGGDKWFGNSLFETLNILKEYSEE